MQDRTSSDLTGEQYLIAFWVGFLAGYYLVWFVVVEGLGWSTSLGDATATVGGICGFLALCVGFRRRNRCLAEHIQRHQGDDSWEGLS